MIVGEQGRGFSVAFSCTNISVKAVLLLWGEGGYFPTHLFKKILVKKGSNERI